MLFNSFEFLIFFPIVTLIYFALPKKAQWIWLLIMSYFFYMNWHAEYALLMAACTIVTHACSLIITDIKEKKHKKIAMWAGIVFNIGLLGYFKYTGFFLEVVQRVCDVLHLPVSTPKVSILLPVGISFYIFQALSYMIDVYKGRVKAERNLFKYALFVSFFPQLVAGPIERSKNLLKQLAVPQKFSFDNLREGLLLMLWGFFLKIVAADRIAVLVDTIYGDYVHYQGMYLIVATLLFLVQIYCDFSGYSTIAMGAAKVLGIQLMENFAAPFLASSVAGFWRRWHISLTSWFKDYLYIPLGGSRKGKFRKYVNKMIVFLVSGLWHGADFSFVAWGGINGFYQVIGEMLQPARNAVVKGLHLRRESLGHKLVHVIGTFLLVDFSFIFFRADSFLDACKIILSIFTIRNPWIILDGSLTECGLNGKNLGLIVVAIAVILFADFCKIKGITIRKVILKQDYWFRWLFIALAIVVIVTFGIWGPNYNEANFIYFQF